VDVRAGLVVGLRTQMSCSFMHRDNVLEHFIVISKSLTVSKTACGIQSM
jgi:hypothetical protein